MHKKIISRFLVKREMFVKLFNLRAVIFMIQVSF